MKIVLTGFMATGKTSTGKALSRRLGYPFIDTDELIVEREGMSITRIFQEKGEPYFREVERTVIREISQKDRIVIAPGGGAIKDKRNVEMLRNRGVLVGLTAEPEVILKRVQAEEGVRPLLNVPDPLSEIKRILQERAPFYMQADLIVETNHQSPEEAAEWIIEQLAVSASSLEVELGERSYEILLGRNILHALGMQVRALRPSKVVVVSNTTVWPIYGAAVTESFKRSGVECASVLMPDGESFKDLYWLNYLYGELLKLRLDRKAMLIALGGGVVGDITGFAASSYMRGIACTQVPTTLLAQVDSSVGGKTGVNHPLGKNMIGSFWQPGLVLIDIDTLKTLPDREFMAGMAEVIKYGVIRDAGFFETLEKERDNIVARKDVLIEIIRKCCAIKADVVSHDEREKGLRAILNFGHTVGHALEAATGFVRYLHGEAIAVGMCAASYLAVLLKMLTEDEQQRICRLIEAYGLPTSVPKEVSVATLLNAMSLDKKAQAGKVRFVLPERIGSVTLVDNVETAMIMQAIESVVSVN
ncbi:MAG TPA: 3-dehydroquinate synthase [Thermodesulfovibrionia bacterium]|nr:3-dehydroquinate synthase [Thermodesulfovibrionia bacterium]